MTAIVLRCTFSYGILRYSLAIAMFVLSLSLLHAQQVKYPKITAKKAGPDNALSPDPLVNYRWEHPQASDDLETYQLHPISWLASNPSSFNTSNLKKTGSILVNGKGSIRLDFGRVSAAWLEFDSDDLKGTVQMSISEYKEPAIVNKGAQNPVKTKAPVKYGNTYRLELNKDLYEGVRFGWIHVESFTRPWHIKNVRLVCQIKPTNYQGSFSCSDPELTKIWYTGAYTVKLNLQKDFFGAILMERSDRHSWTGDAYPSQAASMVAFGNYDFVKSNFKITANQNNGIASYSLYWVLSLIDYINYTGDIEIAEKYLENASKKLDLAYAHYDLSPKLGFYGWDERIGAGFENPNIAEAQNAYKMLSIRAWMEFSQLMNRLGKHDIAKKYSAYASEKIDAVRKQNTWTAEFGLHAAADAVNTNLTTVTENEVFYTHNFTDRVNRISYSPFNEYFIINAMSRMNKYDEALSAVKDCWGGQIKYGGTTFFEVYRPSWNKILGENDAPPNNQCGYTSFAHPWGAGVVKWLSEEILGIKPTEPGFKRFKIIPHLGTTLTSVRGAVPTLNGLITASFDLKTGICSVKVPQGTVAESVAIPIAGNQIVSAVLNGKLIWNGKALIESVSKNDGYLYVNDLKPGQYTFKINYSPHKVSGYIAVLPWVYPINKFKQDSLTAGNWETMYGKNGSILYNFKKEGNLEKLPAYISAVTLKNTKNIIWTELSSDKRALTNPTQETRSVGAIMTQDPLPTLQTMTLDVDAADNNSHQLALYFVDWDNKGRRSAVELFDLKTLKLIAPIQLISNYRGGKYLVFNYTGSIRIRINHVRGENAALSGLFFD
jgi:alpha-L-rhamnosidase